MKTISLFFKKLKKRLGFKNAIILWVSFLLSTLLLIGTIFELPKYFNFIMVVVFLALIFSISKLFIYYEDSRIIKDLEKERFDSFVEYLGDGVVVYDESFKVLGINQTAENLFGVSSKELLGKKIEPGMVKNKNIQALIMVIFPSLAPSINRITDSEKWPQIAEVSLEGPSLDLYTVLHRFFDSENNQYIFIKVIKDISREKTIIQSKNEFIGVAAHQLRTPLTAINWSLESLNGLLKDSSEEVREIIEEMIKLATRALKITNDLLDTTKIEEGKYSYNFEEIDLVDLTEKVVSTAVSEAKRSGVNLYFNSTIKSLKTRIDSMKFAAALSNLIDNAIRYNVENGKVKVSIDQEKDSVIVIVEDTGIGITKEELPKVFDKMQRGKHAAQIDPNGSGLGLFIVKTIVESHGGKIEAESEIKRGSTFKITLPIQN